ncbi:MULTISPECIES: hypothetical protein [unclassified Bifidobacterium]|uniref:hypothetical protein n=1 Tax=unclassified Bifidobacterium TaxID=2608897 RepID=UPI0011284089|nr:MULTISPECIES: hypothetical protein [unclassified Bifidobacterium]TPF78522.1 hypothetical protein BW09_03360 [Bifidobacterium sp. UTCIF-1]TPF80802.1 hypothetical protein BW08_02315 [Bifidobacterium sp. UTCIF-24]TPF82758.1 hypothetical protein BW12_03305 [Bifidobacterium sp. UTCIF-3]TPF84469.1 hypothetical protein BW07_04250 [Bifidobacterium sp. UTCIF-36]TPF90971.1 hypothetical protein BW10_01780 [Bifidobacterium sp. UTBIF-56]
MERTLILVPNRSFYFFNQLELPNVVISPVFRLVHGASQIAWKSFRKLKLSASSLFYEDWYKDLRSFSKIIVFDMAAWLDNALMRNISKHKNSSARCYLYSWNIVRNEHVVLDHFASCEKYGFSYYSYDYSNCKQYGFHFNTIMYDENLHLLSHPLTSDILFLGFLKDRKENMLALYNLISGAGMTPEFVVVENSAQHDNLPFTVKHSYVNYMDYLDMVSRSKAILDITQQGQNGFSMRVMEAIFLNKKLVSTNTALLSADFYDPNNILVIDLQNPDKELLTMFLQSDFHLYDEQIKRYYSVSSWIDRFQQ